MPLLRGFVSNSHFKTLICGAFTVPALRAELWLRIEHVSAETPNGMFNVGWERSPSPELAPHHGIPTQNHHNAFKSSWDFRELRFYPGFAFSEAEIKEFLLQTIWKISPILCMIDFLAVF